jgi:hypothetical protein
MLYIVHIRDYTGLLNFHLVSYEFCYFIGKEFRIIILNLDEIRTWTFYVLYVIFIFHIRDYWFVKLLFSPLNFVILSNNNFCLFLNLSNLDKIIAND